MILTCCALLALLPGNRQDSVDPAALRAQVWETLSSEALPEHVVAELVSFGRPAAPILLDVLLGSAHPPEVLSDPSRPPVPFQDWVEDALVQMPADAVVAAVRDAFPEKLDIRRGLVFVDLLGRVHAEGGTGILLDVFEGLEPIHLRRPYVAQAMERSLAFQLAGKTAPREFSRRAPHLAVEVLPLVVRAAEKLRGQAGVRIFDRLAGRDHAVDESILDALARTDTFEIARSGVERAAAARRFLYDRSPEKRRRAAEALGRLGDEESFQALVVALDDPDRTVQRAAHGALRQLSGLNWPADGVRWEALLAREKLWRDERLPAFERQIGSALAADAVGAIREVAQRRLNRHERAGCLARGLTHTNPRVAIAAVEALCKMGAEALPHLVEALGHAEEEVVQLAHSRLEKLAKRELPATQRAWQEWLGI